ncbi:hypothetical protein [Streptomyces montanisoli]|uniref:Uncharacterized protein n=1 Tax=Streptomyces montanisoli TaxID=2798581 RepID=A0A940MCD4_9ACTN|nr:hypothetical protein [Streptomyces montanisoli]MBP0458323.1 hypothetical protein [Streptomyces montanisoli]
MTAPTTPTPPPHTFLKAGHDHYKAALRLSQDDALPGPSDHLAGLAAECVVKAMLMDFFGAKQDTPDGKPYSQQSPNDKRVRYEHMPKVWDQLRLIASGHRGNLILQQIPNVNPFSTPSDEWDVFHRYRDGDTFPSGRLARHLATALALINAYESAR